MGTEAVDLAAAVGRVLARPVTASEAVPGFLRATMDGYAVAARDTFGASVGAPQYLEIKGEVAMGAAPESGIGPGEVLRVPTGAMLPIGADAVVMIEYTAEHPDQTLEVRRAVAPGENVLQIGEDVQAGELLFGAGTPLRPQDLGLLAALGITPLEVFQRPRVAILSSGDEIVPIDRRPGPGQVRDANAYLAAAQVQAWGGLPLVKGIIADDFAALRAALAAALIEADLILISGGSSVGVRDLTLAAIQDLPGAEVLVHGVAIRPGKPTILAAAGETGTKPLMGLPGHPASAAVVMEVLGRPLLDHLSGLKVRAPWGRTVNAALSATWPGPAAGRITCGCTCAARAITYGPTRSWALGPHLPPGAKRRPGDDPSGGGRAVQRGAGGGAVVWMIKESEQ